MLALPHARGAALLTAGRASVWVMRREHVGAVLAAAELSFGLQRFGGRAGSELARFPDVTYAQLQWFF
jgi:hypothetical protein